MCVPSPLLGLLAAMRTPALAGGSVSARESHFLATFRVLLVRVPSRLPRRSLVTQLVKRG